MIGPQNNHTVLALAAARGIKWDGFDLDYMFPAGTNFEELGKNDEPGTARLLSFHLRRSMLMLLHSFISKYSSFPQLNSGFLAKAFNRIFGIPESFEHYHLRPTSLSELSALQVNGPIHVAVSLKYSPLAPPPKANEPRPYKLATGEIVKPSQEDFDEYQRERDRIVEEVETYQEKEISRLLEEVAQLVMWAMLSRSVRSLTIFERYGVLTKYKQRLHHTLEYKLEIIPEHDQRDVNVRFFNEPAVVPEGDLNIVIASDTLKGSSVAEVYPGLNRNTRLQKLIGTAQDPDLFIAFSGSTGGFPLYALENSLLFSPRRRQLLRETQPHVLEWIQALKLYQYLKTQYLAESTVKNAQVSV